MKTYLISYSAQNGGIGNTVIKRNKRIRTEKDIRDIEKELAEHYKRQIVIITWNKLWK